MSQTLQLEMVMATDVGQVRERNEDAVRILSAQRVAILADGMGGHNAGDVASRMAVDIVGDTLERGQSQAVDALIAAVRAANEAILAVSNSRPECRGMGATILVSAFDEHRVTTIHLGDSRLYLHTDDGLQQLTEDHTLAQHYVHQGVLSPVEAKTWVGRNMLLKALGIERRVEPGITYTDIEPGQIYLLCSDGLTDAIEDDAIAAVLADASQSPQAMADELIQLANASGGPDNISIILARLSEDTART